MKLNLLHIVYTTVIILCLFLAIFGCEWTKIISLLLFCFWIFQGNYKKTIGSLVHNKIATCFLITFGLLFFRFVVQIPSPNAIQNIMKYLPLLICPFVIGSSCCVDATKKFWIFFSYVTFILINTLFCFGLFISRDSSILNTRAISLFMPFIDYSLYVILAIAVCIHYLLFENRELSIFKKYYLTISTIWLLFFVIYLKSLTGYITLFTSIFFSTIYFSKNFIKKTFVTSFILLTTLLLTGLLYSEAKYFLFLDKCNVEELETQTELGNPYTHTISRDAENGHLVSIYICEKEIEDAWQERTQQSVWSKDRWGNIYYYTLLRYMTSKNLKKDASGFSRLSDDDIKAIQNGFTKYRFTNNKNPFKRIYEAFWELNTYYAKGNPNGHSIIQRFEFYKCAFSVIKKHFWFGCGDSVNAKLQQVYSEEKILTANRWHLPHNQFILLTCICGCVGLIIYIFSLLGIIYFSKKSIDIIKITWFIIILIANCSKDFLNDISGQLLYGFIGPLIFITFSKSDENVNPIELSQEDSSISTRTEKNT